MEYCEQNMIDVCFLPPHTSHVLQPLDIGVFNGYKAAYRRSLKDGALNDIDFDWTSAATRQRVQMLGRALIAHMKSCTPLYIKRAFLHTGIYPCSLHNLLYYSKGIRNVPEEMQREADHHVAMEKEAKKRRIQDKPRVTITEHMTVVENLI